jgi:hypothetical protein
MTRYAVVMNQLVGTRPEASAFLVGAMPKNFATSHVLLSSLVQQRRHTQVSLNCSLRRFQYVRKAESSGVTDSRAFA